MTDNNTGTRFLIRLSHAIYMVKWGTAGQQQISLLRASREVCAKLVNLFVERHLIVGRIETTDNLIKKLQESYLDTCRYHIDPKHHGDLGSIYDLTYAIIEKCDEQELIEPLNQAFRRFQVY